MRKRFTGIGAFVVMVCLLLSSCQTLKVDTFNKQYAAAMTAISAVYTVTANGVEAGKISKQDGRAIMERADQVRNFFGTAKIAYNTNPEEGISAMNYAIAALQLLQQELNKLTGD